ncbi:hypothetical protein HMPREF3039_00173 [Akkermansia sp. KLE1798]|nr:hypothetical protein HMPREF3039_00173 [Akkermansia sp. KLE1798]
MQGPSAARGRRKSGWKLLLLSLLILFHCRNMRRKPCCSWRRISPLTAILFFIRYAGIRRERDEKG